MDPATDVYIARSRMSSVMPASVVPVAGLRGLLDRYVDENGMLSPPWPGPDRKTSGSWVWSDFSAERVRERAEAIFSAALQCYDHFTNTLLASLAARMRVAATSPAVARGSVMFSDRPDYQGAPMLFWHLEPLPLGCDASRAEFVLGERPTHRLEERRDQLRSARPDAARWIFAVSSSSALDIFGVAPAAQYMYEWLWDDLKTIGWVKGLVSASWPQDVVPPLA